MDLLAQIGKKARSVLRTALEESRFTRHFRKEQEIELLKSLPDVPSPVETKGIEFML